MTSAAPLARAPESTVLRVSMRSTTSAKVSFSLVFGAARSHSLPHFQWQTA